MRMQYYHCGVVVRNAVQGGCVCTRTVGDLKMTLVSIGTRANLWVVLKGCLRKESPTTVCDYICPGAQFQKGSLPLHMHLHFEWNNATTSKYALTLRYR